MTASNDSVRHINLRKINAVIKFLCLPEEIGEN